MLETRYWDAGRNRIGNLTLTVMPMFETFVVVFDFRTVALSGQIVLLGLLSSRVRINLEPPSGFNFDGPSDLKSEEVLAAVYLAPQDFGGSSLN